MLRQSVLREWNNCKAKVLQFTAEGIGSNYVRMKKVALLSLDNQHLQVGEFGNFTPATTNLYDVMVSNGQITKTPTRIQSGIGVELLVELLEVIILQDLTDDPTLANYEEKELEPDNGPQIPEVD